MIIKYNNKIVTKSHKWCSSTGATPIPPGPGPGPEPDPYNPLNLPPNTVRVRTSDGQPPIKGTYTTYDTATLVSGTNNVYDVYIKITTFKQLLYGSSNVVEIIGANTSNITDMSRMFSGCSKLSSISLFNTSNVTNMNAMFSGCLSLKSLPLLDTSSVTDTRGMFHSCLYVESGTLALYQQLSTQANPPTLHTGTFYDCGELTTTGAAELAQIPSDWK